MSKWCLVILVVLASCNPGHPAPDRREVSRGNELLPVKRDTTSETPLWRFGRSTTRTDPLPLELDSLKEWGEYPEEKKIKPVAYAVDVNNDAAIDWLVRSAESLCGLAGCPTKLITRRSDGTYADLLDGLAEDLYVTNRKVGGWPVLWIYKGGIDGGLSRLQYQNGAYVSAGSLFRNADRFEWTREQYERDSLWKKIEAAPVR